MIQLKLFITRDGDNVLNKTLTDITTVNGDFNSDLDILNPIVRIGGLADVGEYNYCYIPSLSRYYFINEYTIERANYFILYLKCDLLMTYRSEIKALYGIVTRGVNANPYKNGYIDSFDVRRTKVILEFENNFNENGSIILIASKGNSS